jgi:hypothetical protein
MATHFAFGKIVTDGLVLALDAADKNSYPGSGTTWRDLSGNTNNNTLTNGPTFNSANGGSIVFDGVDDFCQGTIPSSAFSSAHSICCWFYRNTITNWSALFSNNVGTNSCSILTFMDGTNFLGVNQVGVQAANIAADIGSHLNRWIYVTITFAGASSGNTVTVYVYKDGSLLTNSGPLYWNLSTGTSYYIGRHHQTEVQILNGNIPSVSVYNRALSASEILQNYNAQKSRFGL